MTPGVRPTRETPATGGELASAEWAGDQEGRAHRASPLHLGGVAHPHSAPDLDRTAGHTHTPPRGGARGCVLLSVKKCKKLSIVETARP